LILQEGHFFSVIKWFALNPVRPSLPALWAAPASFSVLQFAQGNIHVLWQLVTFQFLHSGALHLLMNCVAIFFFGRVMEETLGRSGFLKLYFLSGITGGVLQVALSWFLPGHFGLGPVLGASAGAFGLVAAFAALYPEQSLTVLLAFIIPVTMRAKYLLYGFGLFALVGVVAPFGNVAHAAHLGGMLAGVAYIVWRVKPADGLFAPRSSGFSETPRELVNASAPRRSLWQRDKERQPDDLPPAEFISREVDPILDKISAHGIQSLTPRERRILEAARHKMGRK
jgi:membrane associated rhomboid family serine protease